MILIFPAVTQYFLLINSGYLVHEKWLTANKNLKILTEQNIDHSKNPTDL